MHIVNGTHISKHPNKILGEVKDIEGKRFNDLTAINFDHKDNQGRAVWNCRCICGHTRLVRENHLQTNTIKSCGFSDHQTRLKNLKIQNKNKPKPTHPGITWNENRQKYRITISIGHRQKKYIGQSNTLEQAKTMQAKALEQYKAHQIITTNHNSRHFNGIIGIGPSGKKHYYKNVKDAQLKLDTNANLYRHLKSKQPFTKKNSKLFGWKFLYPNDLKENN